MVREKGGAVRFSLAGGQSSAADQAEATSIPEDTENPETTGSDDDESEKVNGTSGTAAVSPGSYVLLAWNDLGMHCLDGKDYSIFSILPPYNNLHGQLKSKEGGLITAGAMLRCSTTPTRYGR
jgi:hypothetical protein